MNDQLWYIYQKNQQVGPFDDGQIKQMLEGKLIAQDAYFFKVGWKDWQPIEDCLEQLGLAPTSHSSPERRVAAPRISVEGRVIVHNNGQLAIGGGVNISQTGIFVETSENLFQVGERLKLSVRCEGLRKPFNVIAKVIRHNGDSRWPVGYGLKFENLDKNIVTEIGALIARQNEHEPASAKRHLR